MSMGGGGGNQTVKQTSEPWKEQKGYLSGGDGKTGVFPEAEQLYRAHPVEYYPGQTYSPLAPETELGLAAQTNRAVAGSPLTGAMQDELQKSLQGDYLDASKNPYLMPLADQIRAEVLPTIDARFGSHGRSGSGLANRAAGQGVTDALASAAYKNYSDERNRQFQSMLFAPQAANQDYYDIAKLGEVGGVREDLAQQAISEAVNRFQFENMAPWEQLGLYNSMIQGTYGGTSTSTATGPRRSLGSGLLGGAALGGAAGYLGNEGINSLLNSSMSAGTTGLAGGLLGGLAGGILR